MTAGVRTLKPPGALDLRRTLRAVRPLQFIGDEAWRATRTPLGPATERIRVCQEGVEVEAWGAGAEWVLEAAPALLGFGDRPQDFQPGHPRLRDLGRRHPGLRIGATGAVFEALLPAILAQKITGGEAFVAYRGLLRAYGEPAPGPAGPPLPPAPQRLASLPYYAFHRFGVEQRRAAVIQRAAAAAARLEAGAPLTAIAGVGAWTEAETRAVALGDPDAVSVGDYHLPSLVSWALAGERTGTDARMLELLEPYRGHRLRVIRLLEAGSAMPPRRGPRMPFRPFAWNRV